MISSTSRKGVSTSGNPTNNGKKKGNKNSNKVVVVKLSTDPQSVAARERRHRISDRFKMLQSLVPGGAKLDTVSMLEQTIQYVKFLKTQVWLHQAILNNNTNNNHNNNNHNIIDDTSNISANNSNSTMNCDDQYDLNDSSSYYNNDNTYYNDQCFYAMMYGNCNYNYTNQEGGGDGRGGGAFRPEVSLMEMATQATPRHVVEGFSGYHIWK